MTDQISHILRIPRSDQEGSYVLVRVTPSGSAKPLNVRVVATEGVAPYVLSLRHDRIDRLRGQNAPCTADEWEHILTFLLLEQGAVDNVDATVTVQEESNLTVTIRKRVQNITQRLGTLSLAYDGDEDIELFEWCGEAVVGRTEAEQGLAAAAVQQTALQTAVDDLKAQLDEFLETKDADETALLEKFCTLLNEKKLKIRVQQRLLAQATAKSGGGASAEQAAAEAEIKEEEEEVSAPKSAKKLTSKPAPKAATRGQLGRVGGRGAAAGPAKRGAKRRAAVSEPESDSDDGAFEKPAPTRSSARGKEKAIATAAAAADDNDDDADQATQSGEDDRTTENDDESTESEAAESMDEDDNDNKIRPAAVPVEPEEPPPRRTLAFGRARGAAGGGGPSSFSAAPATRGKAAPAAAANDSDSESDDEL